MKRISGVLIILVLIGLIITAGCSQGTPKTTSAIAISPAPTQQTQFNANEPASDGNLKVTVLKTVDGDRTFGNNKYIYITVQLENLRTDKKIQIMGSDFKLLSSNYDITQPINLNLPSLTLDISPGRYTQQKLESVIPQDAKNLKLQFDFSGPSGVGKGGKVVWFVL